MELSLLILEKPSFERSRGIPESAFAPPTKIHNPDKNRLGIDYNRLESIWPNSLIGWTTL